VPISSSFLPLPSPSSSSLSSSCTRAAATLAAHPRAELGRRRELPQEGLLSSIVAGSTRERGHRRGLPSSSAAAASSYNSSPPPHPPKLDPPDATRPPLRPSSASGRVRWGSVRLTPPLTMARARPVASLLCLIGSRPRAAFAYPTLEPAATARARLSVPLPCSSRPCLGPLSCLTHPPEPAAAAQAHPVAPLLCPSQLPRAVLPRHATPPRRAPPFDRDKAPTALKWIGVVRLI
jgi:hypothetical protein